MRLLYHYLFITAFIIIIAFNASAKNDTEKSSEKVENTVVIDRITSSDIEVVIPAMVFSFKDVTIKLKFKNPQHSKLLLNNNKLHFIINGEDTELIFINGQSSFTHKFSDGNKLSIYIEEFSYNQQIKVIPLWAIIAVVSLIIFLILRSFLKKKKWKTFPGAN